MKRSFCILSLTGMALALPVLPEVNCRVTTSAGDVGASCKGSSPHAEIDSLHIVVPISMMCTC
jgi:hypothetical protein